MKAGIAKMLPAFSMRKQDRPTQVVALGLYQMRVAPLDQKTDRRASCEVAGTRCEYRRPICSLVCPTHWSINRWSTPFATQLLIKLWRKQCQPGRTFQIEFRRTRTKVRAAICFDIAFPVEAQIVNVPPGCAANHVRMVAARV